MNKRSFTNEFREETVKLVLSSGKTYKQVGEELGVCYKTISNWVRLYKSKDGSKELAIKPSEREELIKLRRDIKRVEMERDILKKAVGICTNGLP